MLLLQALHRRSLCVYRSAWLLSFKLDCWFAWFLHFFLVWFLASLTLFNTVQVLENFYVSLTTWNKLDHLINDPAFLNCLGTSLCRHPADRAYLWQIKAWTTENVLALSDSARSVKKLVAAAAEELILDVLREFIFLLVHYDHDECYALYFDHVSVPKLFCDVHVQLHAISMSKLLPCCSRDRLCSSGQMSVWHSCRHYLWL